MAKKKKKKRSIAGIPAAIGRFTVEARDELKKVTWPTRETTTNYTIVVIIASLVIGVVTGGIDYALAQILEFFVS